MKAFNKTTGKIGEDFAAKLLTEKGFTIVKRNFSTRFGEIDLVCQDGDTIVFVEVKTKKGLAFGSPEEMFGAGKARRVKHMGLVYLNGKAASCRIDMVAVVLNADDSLSRITHYPNVVYY